MEITGTLRFTRTGRRLVENPEDDLLAPVETPRKPRLDGRKQNGKATVRCPQACDIEALIGVFGQKNGKPHISHPVRRKQRLRAKGTTTVTVPLNARLRKAARAGTAVMALEVRTGASADGPPTRCRDLPGDDALAAPPFGAGARLPGPPKVASAATVGGRRGGRPSIRSEA